MYTLKLYNNWLEEAEKKWDNKCRMSENQIKKINNLIVKRFNKW